MFSNDDQRQPWVPYLNPQLHVQWNNGKANDYGVLYYLVIEQNAYSF